MSLWRRGKTWWAYFYIDGIRHQYSTGTSNRRQAEQILEKLKAEANARRHQIVQIDPEMSFTALAARFIASGSARPHHQYHLKFLLPYFGETPLVKLTKNQAAEYRRHRLGQNQIKEATVNRDLSVLRHVLYWAVDEALLTSNPLARLKLAREPRVRRQVMSVEEEQTVLASAPDHLRKIVIAALDTGMRRGEILSQLWEHVDFSRRLLFVTKSKTPQGEAREIPLSERLYHLLAGTRKERGLIFTFRGNQIRIIKTTWQSTLRRAKIRHIRFHDLRHTFNTRLMEAGILQEIRMALMGHSSGHKVHSSYTHIETRVKREAIAKLEQWVQAQIQSIGGTNADTETARGSSGGYRNQSVQDEGTQTLEKEDARRGGARTGGETETGDRPRRR